jgi:hypothetical protein
VVELHTSPIVDHRQNRCFVARILSFSASTSTHLWIPLDSMSIPKINNSNKNKPFLQSYLELKTSNMSNPLMLQWSPRTHPNIGMIQTLILSRFFFSISGNLSQSLHNYEPFLGSLFDTFFLRLVTMFFAYLELSSA